MSLCPVSFVTFTVLKEEELPLPIGKIKALGLYRKVGEAEINDYFAPGLGFDALLERLGYTHFPLGDFDLVYPFFKRPDTWPSTHHVHLCVSGSEQEQDHIAFRDYLRGNPAAAAAYVELKRGLAAVHLGLTMESQEQYSLAKTAFIRSALKR